MRLRFITLSPGSGWGSAEFESESAAVGAGHVIEGRNPAFPQQRVELHHAPVFRGYVGPMWDGGCLRYESDSANDALST